MYFHLFHGNINIFSGELNLMTLHTAMSETANEPCFLVYLHKILVHNHQLFNEWKEKFLKFHKATGSSGLAADSTYCYMEFSLDKFRGDFDFSVSKSSHSRPTKVWSPEQETAYKWWNSTLTYDERNSFDDPEDINTIVEYYWDYHE